MIWYIVTYHQFLKNHLLTAKPAGCSRHTLRSQHEDRPCQLQCTWIHSQSLAFQVPFWCHGNRSFAPQKALAWTYHGPSRRHNFQLAVPSRKVFPSQLVAALEFPGDSMNRKDCIKTRHTKQAATGH